MKNFRSLSRYTVFLTMEITRPTLLLDVAKTKNNLAQMLERAKSTGTRLVPHFKTHQSKEVGKMYRDVGIDAIAVSSVKMATYFAKHGWNDITIAFPFNSLEMGEVNALLRQGITVTILISDQATPELLGDKIEGTLNVFIEVDAGYGRSGISHENHDAIHSLLENIERIPGLHFIGFYAHPGDTYHAETTEEIKALWADVRQAMLALKSMVVKEGRTAILRMGDTPGCSVVTDMEGIDEIGPGNFIFYDLVMNYLGVCTEDEIAVAVACPIVAKSDVHRQLVIHGGAVHFSKDHLLDDKGDQFYGEMVILEEEGWSPIIPEARLVALSQEHGILKVSDEVFDTLQVGDVVGFLPIHSCLTANLMKSYTTLDGEIWEHLEDVGQY
mgnify:CR=1 FL=1